MHQATQAPSTTRAHTQTLLFLLHAGCTQHSLAMASHGAAAFLIASLLVALAAGADARLAAVHRGASGAYYVAKEEAAVAVPALTCSKVHGVPQDETCFAVAQAAGLTQDQFLGFNPNINCETVFVGQWVCLAATSA